MTARPCHRCGEPIPTGTYCPDCHPGDTKPTAHSRGYDAAWTRLSRRARKLQPFCSDCGATNDLQTDHSPEAWARKARGKPIRLTDIDVVCGPCNRARGQARPGREGKRPGQRPEGKAQKALHLEMITIKGGGGVA
ncbi:hypothetical protein GSI01S_02_01390 [Gordonia sihwensis NBRC 108236]|uniref:HNH endonuclease n=1 Tax=Gordonia sihwensis NBRC 108236 TaxID=1223544 RepID=L7LFK6_9ACTN|nr:hypothetical protein GSI01S_02_01390 [Gordonia sihwensis NBRC 108236]